jgi:hypothetical protein
LSKNVYSNLEAQLKFNFWKKKWTRKLM